MKAKINTFEFKYAIIFIVFIILLAILGNSLQSFILPKDFIKANPILTKNYLLLGFTSTLLIASTYYIYTQKPTKLPMLYLALTIFKLGLFIVLFLNEENIPRTVRIAFLIPVISFLLIEKIYALTLFRKLDRELNNSI